MLPTEAQWEFAAKGGNHSKGYVYSGSDVIDDVAWYSENADDICEVKQKLPNELGLYDMSGNVDEITSDSYSSYSDQDVVDPTITSGSGKVRRGGDCHDTERYCTCTFRTSNTGYVGFRLASY